MAGFSGQVPAKVEVVPVPSSAHCYECLLCLGGSSQSVSTSFSRTTLTIHNVQVYYYVLQILRPVFRILVFKPANQRNNNAVKTSNSTYFNHQLNAQFLYSITICMLHYNPRHVSSINMLDESRLLCSLLSAVCSHPAYCTALYRE